MSVTVTKRRSSPTNKQTNESRSESGTTLRNCLLTLTLMLTDADGCWCWWALTDAEVDGRWWWQTLMLTDAEGPWCWQTLVDADADNDRRWWCHTTLMDADADGPRNPNFSTGVRYFRSGFRQRTFCNQLEVSTTSDSKVMAHYVFFMFGVILTLTVDLSRSLCGVNIYPLVSKKNIENFLWLSFCDMTVP